MKRHVIIGNGTAAVGCIEGIRSVNREDAITVVSKENHSVYSRPLISYYLEGKTDTERMRYRDENFYSENRCDVRYGVTVDKIDTASGECVLSSGERIPFDDVCVAAGSTPFVPPMEGLDTVPKRFGFMTLDDALSLEKELTPKTRVLIVGAGLIGLKCAEGIRDRVGSIIVCDLADRVLSSILDSECAAIVQKHLESNGISFLLSDSVAKFDGCTAYMKSGASVAFDVLVLAVGVRANIGLVKDLGGTVNRGIVVDTAMETSIPGVYAAGDCAEGYDASLGANRVLAILPNAYLQGRTAGINMAGGDEKFTNGIPMNSIGFFGLHIMSAGTYDGEMSEEKADGILKRFFVRDDHLRGYILIGETGRAGIYTALVREQTPLSEIDFEAAKKIAGSAIFSADVRRKKFGGAV
ncbi:MAG: NAD(P)/FAD-dependent oxidoreductase [Lachnospiraceae bacterium]|nr:NAD(P)/FAD-dependent oxidoreductase [Lachnospiraceae bacterium]